MVILTVPFSSVVPVMFVPFGNVTFTGTPGTGLSSSSVTFTVIVPLLSVTFIVVLCFTVVTGTVLLAGLYVSFPGYVMVMLLVPVGCVTGIFTLPVSSVVPFPISFPSLSFMTIGAPPIGLPSSSLSSTSTLVCVFVPLFTLTSILVGIVGILISVVTFVPLLLSSPGVDTVML